MGRYPSLVNWSYQPVSQEFQNCIILCVPLILPVAGLPPTQSPPDSTESPAPLLIVLTIGKQVRVIRVV